MFIRWSRRNPTHGWLILPPDQINLRALYERWGKLRNGKHPDLDRTGFPWFQAQYIAEWIRGKDAPVFCRDLHREHHRVSRASRSILDPAKDGYSLLRNRKILSLNLDPEYITQARLVEARPRQDEISRCNTYTALLRDVDPKPGKSKTETYEDTAKDLFQKQPANMRLLIVVDKLLTGFDAPSCTYLYIDKSMRDHGLFQAICRTNRLDGDDKTFGYIVDYKDLFKNLVNEKGTGALQVYTSELDDSAGGSSPEILLQDRLKKGRERLDAALEAVKLLCDPVKPPKGELEHIHYFCGNTEIPDDLKSHETQRAALYKSIAGLVRAYANIADDLPQAGYTAPRVTQIKQEVDEAVKLRDIIRQASGETIDLKAYEADMRHLIDTYIEAKEPRKISQFGEIGLIDLIVQSGMAEAIKSLPEGIRGSKQAVAETIANNVRSKIIKDHLNDPAFYDKMSALLQEILADLKAARIDYETFLKRIASQIIAPLHIGKTDDTPAKLDTPGKRALYSNLKAGKLDNQSKLSEEAALYQSADAALRQALRLDEIVKRVRPNGWRGVRTKEQIIKGALFDELKDDAEVERIFLIIFAQQEY